MENNSSRGRYTLTWMKITLIVGVLFAAVCGWLWMDYGAMLMSVIESAGAGQDSANELSQEVGAQMAGAGFLFLVQVFFLCVLGFALGVCASIEMLFWSLWILRTVRNLRVVGQTRFSPWGALLLGWIPYVNVVMHYFVFRDIVQRQESYLSSRGIKFNPVSMKCAKAWFVGLIAMTVLSFAPFSLFVTLLGAVLTAVVFVLYIKTFGQYIEAEKSVYACWQDSVVQQKVDQVLRERDLEKAVSEIQQAQFDAPKADETGDKPSEG